MYSIFEKCPFAYNLSGAKSLSKQDAFLKQMSWVLLVCVSFCHQVWRLDQLIPYWFHRAPHDFMILQIQCELGEVMCGSKYCLSIFFTFGTLISDLMRFSNIYFGWSSAAFSQISSSAFDRLYIGEIHIILSHGSDYISYEWCSILTCQQAMLWQSME